MKGSKKSRNRNVKHDLNCFNILYNKTVSPVEQSIIKTSLVQYKRKSKDRHAQTHRYGGGNDDNIPEDGQKWKQIKQFDINKLIDDKFRNSAQIPTISKKQDNKSKSVFLKNGF